MTVAHKNLGGSFNDFLEEEGILEECTQTAIKRVLVSCQVRNDAHAFVIARPKAVAISWMTPTWLPVARDCFASLAMTIET